MLNSPLSFRKKRRKEEREIRKGKKKRMKKKLYRGRYYLTSI